jgi:hypothetical protein
MKYFFLGVFTTLAALVVGGFAYLRLGWAEVRGDLPPSQLESYLMTKSVHASVRRRAPDSESTAASLYPPVPQLPKVGTEYSEAQIFWIAKHGVRRTGMFANGKWDSDKKPWTVAAYVQRIKSLPPHVQQELAKKPSATQ